MSEIETTLIREADHRARMSIYLGVTSLVAVPLAIPAIGLWHTTRDYASRGGAHTAKVGRNFAIAALVVWLLAPLLFLIASAVAVGAAIGGAGKKASEPLPASVASAPNFTLPRGLGEEEAPVPSKAAPPLTAAEACERLQKAGFVSMCVPAVPKAPQLVSEQVDGWLAGGESGQNCTIYRARGTQELSTIEQAIRGEASLRTYGRASSMRRQMLLLCHPSMSAERVAAATELFEGL